MLGDITSTAIGEAHRARCRERPLDLLCLPGLDWIDAVEQQQTRGLGTLTRFLQADDVQRSEPEHVLAVITLVTKQPARALRSDNLQIQAVTVVVPSRVSPQACDPFCRQSHSA